MKERIDQLEKKCKRLTLAVTGMMVLAVGVVCIAAKPNPAIQTNTLEIVDDEGNVRIRLGRADSGYGVVVYDADGNFGATLTDSQLGAGMQLRKDGGSIKMLAMKKGCGFTIRDVDGKPRAMILQHQEGSQLILKDGAGKNTFSAPE